MPVSLGLLVVLATVFAWLSLRPAPEPWSTPLRLIAGTWSAVLMLVIATGFGWSAGANYVSTILGPVGAIVGAANVVLLDLAWSAGKRGRPLIRAVRAAGLAALVCAVVLAGAGFSRHAPTRDASENGPRATGSHEGARGGVRMTDRLEHDHPQHDAVPDASPSVEPSPVGSEVLPWPPADGPAIAAAASLPSLPTHDAPCADLQSCVFAVGNTWVYDVERAGSASDESVLQSYVATRVVDRSEPFRGGSLVGLVESGGPWPPRRYALLVTKRCVRLPLTDRELFCIDADVSRRVEGADKVAVPAFAVNEASHPNGRYLGRKVRWAYRIGPVSETRRVSRGSEIWKLKGATLSGKSYAFPPVVTTACDWAARSPRRSQARRIARTHQAVVASWWPNRGMTALGTDAITLDKAARLRVVAYSHRDRGTLLVMTRAGRVLASRPFDGLPGRRKGWLKHWHKPDGQHLVAGVVHNDADRRRDVLVTANTNGGNAHIAGWVSSRQATASLSDIYLIKIRDHCLLQLRAGRSGGRTRVAFLRATRDRLFPVGGSVVLNAAPQEGTDDR